VIMLTRLNGAPFALNPDLIERAEATPDTVIVLVDGKHYVVHESLPEVIARVQQARAAVLGDVAAAQARSEHDGQARAHQPTTTTDAPADVIPMRRNH
jgi:flagellar protein FlbD